MEHDEPRDEHHDAHDEQEREVDHEVVDGVVDDATDGGADSRRRFLSRGALGAAGLAGLAVGSAAEAGRPQPARPGRIGPAVALVDNANVQLRLRDLAELKEDHQEMIRGHLMAEALSMAALLKGGSLAEVSFNLSFDLSF